MIRVAFRRDELSRHLLAGMLLLFLVLHLFISHKVIWVLYILFLALMIASRHRIVTQPLLVLAILGLPLIWGFFMSWNDDLNEAVKGFYYLSIPLIMTLIGFQLRKIFTARQFFSYVVIIGTAMAIIYIVLTLSRAGLIAFIAPYEEARYAVGSGTPVTVMSLVTALFSPKFGLPVPSGRFLRRTVIVINLVAVYLFASRTFWVMFLIFIAFFSLRIMKRKTFIILVTTLTALVILLVIFVNSQKGLTYNNSLVYKLVNSFAEIRFSEFKSDRDINTFYRGYETYRCYKTWSEGNLPEILLGGGFGKLIDLKASVLLSGSYWTQVPYVHNGFFFVLVKHGALGFIFLILYYFLVADSALRNYNSPDKILRFKSVFLLSALISLFVINYVDSGMYSMEMPLIMIAIGYLTGNNNANNQELK